MPELPEVEAARQRIHLHCCGKKVVSVKTDGDKKVFFNDSSRQFEKAMKGATVVDTGRKGKNMWLVLDNHLCVYLHLGMAGNIEVEDTSAVSYMQNKKRAKEQASAMRGEEKEEEKEKVEKPAKPTRRRRTSAAAEVSEEKGAGGEEVKEGDRDKAWPPKYWKFTAEMEGGQRWAMVDFRRFGSIRVMEDPLSCPPVSLLGFDVLDEVPEVEVFNTMLTAKSAPVKGVLLDQAFCAGVGNWIADEVLYQARVHPAQKACTLTLNEVKAIHEKLKYVVRTAVDVQADSSKFPPTWLFHYRWTGKKASKTHSGQNIKFETVATRTTAIVPAVQKLHGQSKVVGVKAKKGGGKERGAEKGNGKGKKRGRGEEKQVEEGRVQSGGKMRDGKKEGENVDSDSKRRRKSTAEVKVEEVKKESSSSCEVEAAKSPSVSSRYARAAARWNAANAKEEPPSAGQLHQSEVKKENGKDGTTRRRKVV